MSEQACPPIDALLPLLDAPAPSDSLNAGGDIDPALAQHVRGCSRCQGRLEQMRSRRTTMRGLPPVKQPHETAASGHPALIGKYLVVGVLRQSATYTVYRAAHMVLQENVAIQLAADPVVLESARNMMLGEARVLAQIRHRNAATVLDFDFFEDRPYVVTQYVRGPAIDDVGELGVHGVQRSVAWIASLADALAAAHQVGAAHLDIQPRHIRVDDQDQPMLLLFGSALLQRVRDGAIPEGDPAYLSPEQASRSRDQVGPAGDVFSLAAVLFFLLTGKPPFAGVDPAQTLAKAAAFEIDLAPLLRCDLPPKLRDTVIAGLSRHAADRPSAKEFAERVRLSSKAGGFLARIFRRAVS